MRSATPCLPLQLISLKLYIKSIQRPNIKLLSHLLTLIIIIYMWGWVIQMKRQENVELHSNWNSAIFSISNRIKRLDLHAPLTFTGPWWIKMVALSQYGTVGCALYNTTRLMHAISCVPNLGSIIIMLQLLSFFFFYHVASVAFFDFPSRTEQSSVIK